MTGIRGIDMSGTPVETLIENVTSDLKKTLKRTT